MRDSTDTAVIICRLTVRTPILGANHVTVLFASS